MMTSQDTVGTRSAKDPREEAESQPIQLPEYSAEVEKKMTHVRACRSKCTKRLK